MENVTLFGNMNDTTGLYQEMSPYNFTYIYICVPIITFCIIMVGVNLVILASLYWIRRPLSPTLHISLSLACSDVWTLILDSLGLFFNSLLPIGLGIEQQLLGKCSLLVLEGLRMGGRLTTVGHLLFLALNHYLGIRRPLHYASYCTYWNICVLASILWILPSAAIIGYFSVLPDDGLRHPDCTYKFLITSDFRKGFSVIFFSSIILMGVIYCHIYLIVRRHQANRNRFRRAGSVYNRNHHSTEQQQENRNEKAIITTLLIVGSTVVGWLPASLSFALVCSVDCVFKGFGSETLNIAVGAGCNILLILKTALNSYIYAARMQEIKLAMKKMRYSLKKRCCTLGSSDLNGLSELQSRGSTRRSRRTILCRIQSLGRHRENSTQL